MNKVCFIHLFTGTQNETNLSNTTAAAAAMNP